MTKICTKCKIEKDINEFYFRKDKYKYFSHCRECTRIHKKYYNNINKERNKLTSRMRYLKNIEKRKIYLQNNRENIRARERLYEKNKRKNDINYKLKKTLRSRIVSLLKGKDKSKHTMELLGCSIEFFKKYLEVQFQSGMTWENHGFYGWHIDHKIPCSSFDLSKPEEQAKCFHYTNMQPLWMKDNIIKKDKILPEYNNIKV